MIIEFQAHAYISRQPKVMFKFVFATSLHSVIGISWQGRGSKILQLQLYYKGPERHGFFKAFEKNKNMYKVGCDSHTY